MNKDEQTDDEIIRRNPGQEEQCDDDELKIKFLEKKRDELKKEKQKRQIQELEEEIGMLSQTASEQQNTKPQFSTKVQERIDCQVIIESGFRNLTKEIDRRNDYKLQISPHANWGKLLTPAPMAISLLAELCFMSAKVDFDLKSQRPIGGFKYIKYPDSFRACLVQISNSGWRAFNEAHTCMDQIRLMTGSVDKHVQEAIILILDGTALEVEKGLPNVLHAIDEIAIESLELAKNIEHNFNHVMDLTGELLEVSISKQSAYDKEISELKAEKKDIALELKHEEKLKREHTDRLDKMEKKINLAQKNYEEAVSDQPGALSILGISLAEGLVDAVKSITSLPTEIVRGLGLGTYGIVGQLIQRKKELNTEKTKSLEIQIAEHNLLTHVSFIEPSIDELQLVIDNAESVGSNADSKGKTDLIKSLLLRYQNKVSSEQDCGKLSKDISWICKSGEEICISLGDCFSSIKTIDKQIILKNREKFDEIKQKTREIMTQFRKTQGIYPLDERPTCTPQRPIQASNALSTVIENSRFKLESAKDAFKDIQMKQELAEKELEKAANSIFEATKKMQKLNIKEVDFETIKIMLQDGIAVLAEVREQWANLVLYFSQISNLIKCCMNVSLKTFSKTISTRADLKAAGDLMSNAFRAIMYDQTIQASRISFVVCDLATSYVSVSTDHIMPGVNLLQNGIGLDSIRHETKMSSIRNQLRQFCEKAQTSIYSKIKQEHQELEEQTERRMLQIEHELGVLRLQKYQHN